MYFVKSAPEMPHFVARVPQPSPRNELATRFPEDERAGSELRAETGELQGQGKEISFLPETT